MGWTDWETREPASLMWKEWVKLYAAVCRGEVDRKAFDQWKEIKSTPKPAVERRVSLPRKNAGPVQTTNIVRQRKRSA